jgi:nitrate reductase delta subunit
MIGTLTIYDLLATLAEYPTHGFYDRTSECVRELGACHPEGAAILQPFAEHVRELSLEEQEELFTRTFDINPVCCLEIGWQLFGEDYARGSFLVKMRRSLRAHELPESSELPDHLTHVLALVGRLDNGEANDLAAKCVLPAVKKMLDGMSGKDNPYENVLKAIQYVLAERHAKPEGGSQ